MMFKKIAMISLLAALSLTCVYAEQDSCREAKHSDQISTRYEIKAVQEMDAASVKMEKKLEKEIEKINKYEQKANEALMKFSLAKTKKEAKKYSKRAEKYLKKKQHEEEKMMKSMLKHTPTVQYYYYPVQMKQVQDKCTRANKG